MTISRLEQQLVWSNMQAIQAKEYYVTVYELKAYLDDQVLDVTEEYKGEAQYPTIASKGQDFPVGVAK